MVHQPTHLPRPSRPRRPGRSRPFHPFRAAPARTLALALAACAALLAGCDGSDPVTPIDRETFVATVVALRQAATETRTTGGFPERRAEVLEEAGVTEEELQAYVAAVGRDTEHMAALWAEVRERLQSRGEEAMPEDDIEDPADRLPAEERTVDDGFTPATRDSLTPVDADADARKTRPRTIPRLPRPDTLY